MAISLFAFTPKKLVRPLRALIDLLAGIPSVIYGLFGMVIIVPFVRDYISSNGVGYGILSASLILSIMILPTMVGVSLDALNSVEKAYYEGASDYLSKPFGVMELIARINANLRKVEEGCLSYKSLSIHVDTHEIFLSEKKMVLSLKEYELLAYFIENPAKTLSKEELLRSVWGITAEIETRTLDMFVSRLRKKLIGSDVEIQTIRSVGYILR